MGGEESEKLLLFPASVSDLWLSWTLLLLLFFHCIHNNHRTNFGWSELAQSIFTLLIIRVCLFNTLLFFLSSPSYFLLHLTSFQEGTHWPHIVRPRALNENVQLGGKRWGKKERYMRTLQNFLFILPTMCSHLVCTNLVSIEAGPF